MNLSQASLNVLAQLKSVIMELRTADYSRPLISLNNATIGQHVRHTLEFYICMIQGSDKGIVNYDKRERDHRIESDPKTAIEKIEEISAYIISGPENKPVRLEGSYSMTVEETSYSIDTNIERELAYNVEHAVHHMAIIKIGLAETNPGLQLPVDFGVAVSTVRHNN